MAKPSRLIPGRFPSPGVSPIADAIRVRRGAARGLTPLDGALLHVPPIAEGWNALLGAVRTRGLLPGDVGELMILRVAALNHAAFEWIHHEPVGRSHGLTSAQLFVIRDTTSPLPPSTGILSALQTAALVFADASTRTVRVRHEITDALKDSLRTWVEGSTPADAVEEKTEDLLAEAALVVASYNMVSRFLVSMDVAGMSDDPVPWPVERKEHFITLPTHTIHACTIVSDPAPTTPWIVFANSLLTDLSMWDPLLPFLLSPHTNPHGRTYNILLHSQRGHGKSTLPHPTHNGADGADTRQTTIPLLAADIAALLTHLAIPTPIHALIGVSQGGAAALAFAAVHPGLAKSVVACDTAAQTAQGNKEAWEERIRVAVGGAAPAGDAWDESAVEYARALGMHKLARMTVARWFPSPSPCSVPLSPAPSTADPPRAAWVLRMVAQTPVAGFAAGARALGDYDLVSPPPSAPASSLLDSDATRVLLVAGSLDGGGKVGLGMERLCAEWNARRLSADKEAVEYVSVEGAGHLPMVDATERYWNVVGGWLGKF